MSELMRFQIARATQRRSGLLPALPVGQSSVVQGWLEGDTAREKAAAFLSKRGLAPPTRRYTAPSGQEVLLEQLRNLDRYLADRDNRPKGEDLQTLLKERLDGDPGQIVKRWGPLWDDLDAVLVAVVISDAHVDLRADVMRLVLVLGLLKLMAGINATDNILEPLQKSGDCADDVGELAALALRLRDVALPDRLVLAMSGPRSLIVRPPGVADLWVVRDEWARYEAGEIAHIENVLAGESKLRRLEKLTERETTVIVDEERTSVIELDSQSTSRFELASDAQRDTELAAHVEGQFDTSGQYGPTKVTTHLGGSLDYSVADSTRLAVKQATETTQRAVTRLEERVREQRTTRSLTQVRETDKHSFDNSDGTKHVTGIYRWVDKIMRVQLFRYPNRMLYDFQIPEPASFVRWLATRPVSGVTALKPPPFTIDGVEGGTALTPDGVGLTTAEAGKVYYQTLGSRYFASGLQVPPTSTVVFTTLTHPDPDLDVEKNNKPPKYSTSTIVVPAGLEATSFSIYAVATNAVPEKPGKPTGWLELVVGTDFPSTTADDSDPSTIWRFQGTNIFRGLKSMNFRIPITGTVPIQLATDDASGLLATVEVHCRPTAAAVAAWRQSVYDQLSAAYWELKNQYDDEVSQRSLRADISVDGESPARNQQRVREELRKFVLEMLIGESFKGRPAIQQTDLDPGPATVTAPSVNLSTAFSSAVEIQFLEQAFEWENLTYVLYPYYWAGSQRWTELSDVKSPDPVFDEFLRCGSARVILPARPGFENQANLYTLFGTLWGGGPVPGPGDELYLSVAEEIRAQQRPVTDGEPGDTWEVRLPTTLLYLEPTGTTLPLVNENPDLGGGFGGPTPGLWTGTAHQATLSTLTTDQTAWIDWPAAATWQVPIPDWATDVDINFALNPGVVGGDVWGELRLNISGSVTAASMFDVNYEADSRNFPEQNVMIIGDSHPIPSDIRGKTVSVKMQARMLEPAKHPGHLEANRGCHINGQMNFQRRPTT